MLVVRHKTRKLDVMMFDTRREAEDYLARLPKKYRDNYVFDRPKRNPFESVIEVG